MLRGNTGLGNSLIPSEVCVCVCVCVFFAVPVNLFVGDRLQGCQDEVLVFLEEKEI
jgi:hypothetical protein